MPEVSIHLVTSNLCIPVDEVERLGPHIVGDRLNLGQEAGDLATRDGA